MVNLRYFNRDEFACKCGCGTNEIQDEIMEICDDLRLQLGIPLVVTSGYRCPNHPIEAGKDKPGTHAEGIAADLSIPDGVKLREAVDIALFMKVGGVGVGKRFIHLDSRKTTPVLWGY